MSSGVTKIRPARAGEADGLKAVAEAAYAPYIERIGRRPAPMDADFTAHILRGEAFAADLANGLCGYIILFPRGDHLFVENVAVHPDAQGGGIGAALLEFAEAEARRRARSALELYTNAKMTENLSLYPRLGYRETGRRREAGFDRVYFRKDLKSI